MREQYKADGNGGFARAESAAGPGDDGPDAFFRAAGRPVVNHGAAAWATLVQRALLCPFDPKTLRVWAATAACSTTLVKERCRLVGVSAKRTLDFARLLRALRLSEIENVPMAEFLDIADPRTTRRLFRSFAVSPSSRPSSDALVAAAARVFPARCLHELLPRMQEVRAAEGQDRRLSSAS